MSGPWGSEGGLDDQGFITKLRELLEDFPIPADEQFSANGTGTKFKCQRLKVNDDAYLAVTVATIVTPLSTSLSQLSANNAYVDCNTGLVTFGSAPATGTNNVVVYHNQVRWRDQVLLGALNDGLATLFPRVWRNAMDTSITMQVNQWDYRLPADFFDPRCRIRRLSIREIPASTSPFKELSGPFEVYGNPPMLRIRSSQGFSPGATLQIEYAAPYRNLGDLEPQAQMLPIWYAAGALLGFREAQRTRVDGQTVAADANAQPPQYLQNAGGWFMSQYRAQMQQLARPLGVRHPISTLQMA